MVLAGSLPERITHLALIDGVIPPTDKGENAAERMGMALQAQLDLREKRKPVYNTLDRAIEARMKGLVAVSREAAELLAQRGLMPVDRSIHGSPLSPNALRACASCPPCQVHWLTPARPRG